jgi:3-oxoacyl-[acyl-carrier protein] reductase
MRNNWYTETMKMNDRQLRGGKVALVTGSSRGIGKDIALKLADAVSCVAVQYHSDRESALEVAKMIRNKGSQSAVFRANLIKEKSALSLVRRTEQKFGRIDILVNNFGPLKDKHWKKTSTEEWEFTLRSNLLSALFCIQAALPGMRKRKWGRIINLGYSRVEQITAFHRITPYAVAKTGLLILTRTVAVSEAASGITVNMVSPGLMKGSILPRDTRIPAGRPGEFNDISQAVLFLASEDAGYITGANLVVAGGWKL